MKVLVIAAHPDDDALGAGGAIRLHADNGDRVHALYLTSGELGCPGEDPTTVAQRREAEARTAAGELGVAELTFWREEDSALQATDALRRRLGALAEEAGYDLIYVPHAGEGHPDHRAALYLAGAALDARIVRTYEVWTPLTRFSTMVDITATAGVKRSAIRCHRSQISNGFAEAMLALNMYRGLMHGPGMLYAEVFGTL